MISVSYDRYFLDKILQVKKGSYGILEIRQRRFHKYRTDYTGYLQESRLRKERLKHQARIQEREIREIKEFIMRNRATNQRSELLKAARNIWKDSNRLR